MKSAAVVLYSSLCLYAADQLPRFEVASIKPSPPGGQFCGNSSMSSTQLTMHDCALSDFVKIAWSVPKFLFFTPPGQPWISSAKYNIAAKASRPANLSDLWHMLAPVLEDRFKLKWHREKRELPVYFLSVTKGGLKLPPTKPGSCTPWDKKGPPPPPDPKNLPTCDYILQPGTPDGLGLAMVGTAVPMASFVQQLTGLLGRPIIDKTGSTAIFDLHLKFARDSSLAYGGRPDTPDQVPSGIPNIFTSIHTLGLNLESGKAPVEVFVVDSAQKPTEN